MNRPSTVLFDAYHRVLPIVKKKPIKLKTLKKGTRTLKCFAFRVMQKAVVNMTRHQVCSVNKRKLLRILSVNTPLLW